jgi:hypothetical protein
MAMNRLTHAAVTDVTGIPISYVRACARARDRVIPITRHIRHASYQTKAGANRATHNQPEASNMARVRMLRPRIAVLDVRRVQPPSREADPTHMIYHTPQYEVWRATVIDGARRDCQDPPCR